jgi:hypothetical protein
VAVGKNLTLSGSYNATFLYAVFVIVVVRFLDEFEWYIEAIKTQRKNGYTYYWT